MIYNKKTQMVYYMHSFGRQAIQESDSSEPSTISSAPSSPSSPSSPTAPSAQTQTVSESGSSGMQFGRRGRKHSSSSSEMARVMCAVKLGFFAALIMMVLGYVSVKVFKWSLFVKQDPVSLVTAVDWQKLSLYTGVVFLAVSIGAYIIAKNNKN